MNDNYQDNVQIAYYDEIKSGSVDWLWYPYIPYGKVSVIQGDPCTGKSTFVMQLIALLTRGKTLPGCNQAEEPINVLYQCSEDGAGDTIKPRLTAANADLKRVAFIIDEAGRDLAMRILCVDHI